MQNQFDQMNQLPEEQEFNLKDYLHIVGRYKWLVISIFLVVFIAGSIYTAKSPRIYKATAMILLENIASDNFLFASPTLTNSSINNNIEIIKSQPVIEVAYRILQRNKDFKTLPVANIPKNANPISYLKARLSVETKRETDILIVNFQSTSRLETKLATNAIATALKEQNTEYARMEFTSARNFLSEQLEESESRLRTSEEDLRLFKIDNGISILSEETKQLIEQSSDLDALHSEGQIELKVSIQHLDFLINELGKQDSLISNVNSILTSPLLDQLRIEIVANQTRYIKLLAKPEYTEDHPELLSLKEEIENGKDELNAELQRVIAVKTGSSDPLVYRADLISKIAVAKIDKNIAEAKVLSLEEEIEKYNERMTLLPDTELQLARMERNYQIDEKTYSMLTQKYEDAKIAEKSKIGNVRIMEGASIPLNPIKPNKKMNLMISIVLGLGLGIGSALLLHSLDSRIMTFDDVKKYINLPVLGTIPFISIDDQDIDYVERLLKDAKTDEDKEKIMNIQQQIEARIISHYAPKSSTSEAFRILRTNIVNKKKDDEALTMVITSSGPKEGKSTILSNLAVTLAQMDSKVILVDFDLRRPMVHTLLGFDKEHGVSDILYEDNIDYHDFLKKSVIPNLDVLTSGYIPPNPSELLAAHRMEEFMNDLKEEYDYVLFDAPPVIAVTDTMIIAKKVDMLMLVTRVEIAEKGVIKRIKEIFEHIDIDIAGVIINGIQPHRYYSIDKYNY